jgi:hypothetical protein
MGGNWKMMRAFQLLVFTVCGVTAAFGAVLHSNGSFNNLGGNQMGSLVQAEDFTLTSLSNLTSVVFISVEDVAGAGAYSGSIDWSIYSSVGDEPGSLLGGGSASPTRVNLGAVAALSPFVAFENTMSISVTGLAAGSYWLVLHNGPVGTTADSDFYWGWTDLNAGNTGTIRGLEQSLNPVSITWDDTAQEHAFTIFGDVDPGGGVPEPSTLILLSAGLAAIWFRRNGK